MINSDDFINQIVEAVRDAAEGRKPSEIGFGSPHSTAVHLGFIEECTVEKPCRTCGSPRPDWTYWKITLAGQAYLALAQVDRSPKGQDAQRLDRNDESAVRDSECAPKPGGPA